MISIIAFIHNVASATAINLEDNFYVDFNNYDDVAFSDGGYTATLTEGAAASVFLQNDPWWGDPEVINPGANVRLIFDYSISAQVDDADIADLNVDISEANNIDTFQAILFDSEPGGFVGIFDKSLGTPLVTKTTDITSNGLDINFSGTYDFPLSDHVGKTLGLHFELYPTRDANNPPLDNFDHLTVVTISNVRLEQVPEFSTSYLLASNGLLSIIIMRRFLRV